MQLEIRNNALHVSGYVNAVERESRRLPQRMCARARSDFTEKISAGAFAAAIADREIRLMYNHTRDIGGTADGSLKLCEDNIGLKAEAVITDSEVIAAAKRGELRGWSFGFTDAVDRWEDDGAHKEFNKQPDIKVHYNQSKRDNVLKIDGTEYVWGQRVWISMGEAYKKNGRPIWKATVQTICDKAQKNYVMGYLYVGERFTARKHAESVFVQKVKNGRSWEIDNEHLKKLEKTWEVYNDLAVNRNAKENGWYKGYERAKKGGVIPLWYREEKGKLYLSLASIGRKTYGNSLSDIRNVGKSCTNRNHVCKACALFGMVIS